MEEHIIWNGQYILIRNGRKVPALKIGDQILPVQEWMQKISEEYDRDLRRVGIEGVRAGRRGTR